MPAQGVAWVVPGDTAGVVVGAGAGEVTVSLNIPPQYFATGPDSGALAGFWTDGSFLPVPQPAPGARRRVIHALGDSITASTNIHGGVYGLNTCHDNGYQADWAASWTGHLCNWFDADCSVIAVGGKGLVRNCCNNNGPKMPDFYTQLRMTDTAPTFDFASDAAPDAFLIFLGTNDFIDGPTPALNAEFTAAYVAFMRNVTQLWYGTPASPANTTFFAVLGPMSPVYPTEATLDAVAQGRAAGLKVQLLNLTTACGPSLTGCTDGCALHPGARSHRIMADLAAPAIGAAMGWAPPSEGPFPWGTAAGAAAGSSVTQLPLAGVTATA